MNTLFKAALYIRLSREDGDKEESNSVVNQRALLMEYISKYADILLHDVYIDDGCSGTNFNRPSFQRMIADIESGLVNCVIVKDLSRFGRDYIDTGRYLERFFPDKGVRFISIGDQIDRVQRSYDILLPIKNIFNEQYAYDISKKVGNAYKTMQKAGMFTTGHPSYGYQLSPNNKHKLIIDEYASKIVKRIFALFCSGISRSKIAELLNDEGVLSPLAYRYYKQGKAQCIDKYFWDYHSVNNVLKNEMYTGSMVQGKEISTMKKRRVVPKSEWVRVPNAHEAIIDRETWEKAQLLIKKRTRTKPEVREINIFAGFMKCHDCGRIMSRHSYVSKKGTKGSTYYCGAYTRSGRRACTPHKIRFRVIEDIILQDIRKILKTVEDIQILVKKHKLSIQSVKKVEASEIEKLRQEIKRIKGLKKAIYEDYRGEILTKEDFLSYRDDYTQKEELYSKQLSLLEEKQKEIVPENIFELPWLKRLLETKSIEKLTREIVVDVIKEIRVHESTELDIVYNFSSDLEKFLIVTQELA